MCEIELKYDGRKARNRCKTPELTLAGNRDTETGTVTILSRQPNDALFGEVGLQTLWFYKAGPEYGNMIIMSTDGTAGFYELALEELESMETEMDVMRTLAMPNATFHCIKPDT